jgi:hypothetical protein
MTKSSAHADILIPDLFFYYWRSGRPPTHAFYSPPSFVERTISDEEWQGLDPRVYWKGTIAGNPPPPLLVDGAGWRMNARGRLVRLARRHPEEVVAEAVRIVGRGLTEAPDEEERRGGENDPLMARGSYVDPNEIVEGGGGLELTV